MYIYSVLSKRIYLNNFWKGQAISLRKKIKTSDRLLNCLLSLKLQYQNILEIHCITVLKKDRKTYKTDAL